MTEILNARIRTSMSTYQPHSLEILLDDIHREDKVYEVVEHEDGSATYLSVADDIVSYFYHNPKNETGFGGSAFTLRMRDGSERVIRGPWSSNNSHIRNVFGVDSVHVSYTAEPEVFERGYTFYAGDITVELAMKAMEFVDPAWKLVYASSKAKTPKDASGEQSAIIDGNLGGWYVARENCPTNYKVEKVLWPPDGDNKYHKQRLVDRATGKLELAFCLNGWHRLNN